MTHRPRWGAKLVPALALATLATGWGAGAAFAEYPPGSFPGAAPAGAFRTVLLSRTVCAEGDALEVIDGSSTIRVEIPAGAFDRCTQVTIYGVDIKIIAHLLPDGYALVEAAAVGWQPPTKTGVPLVVTISNASLPADAITFATRMGGIGSASFDVQAGSVTASVSRPIGIVVARRGEQQVEATTGRPARHADTQTQPAIASTWPAGMVLTPAFLGLVGSLVLWTKIRRRQR